MTVSHFSLKDFCPVDGLAWPRFLLQVTLTNYLLLVPLFSPRAWCLYFPSYFCKPPSLAPPLGVSVLWLHQLVSSLPPANGLHLTSPLCSNLWSNFCFLCHLCFPELVDLFSLYLLKLYQAFLKYLRFCKASGMQRWRGHRLVFPRQVHHWFRMWWCGWSGIQPTADCSPRVTMI